MIAMPSLASELSNDALDNFSDYLALCKIVE
jgi:hypothetical protein